VVPNDLLNVQEGTKEHGTISVNHDFFMSETDITQEEYLRVLGDNPSNRRFGELDGPVECVTRDEANQFCRELGHLENRVYRLPTSTEWKYAYYSGQLQPLSMDNLGKMAWYKDNSHLRPHSVRQLLPDRWGLRDMIGNVRQWCSDSEILPNPSSDSAVFVEGTDYSTVTFDCLDATKREIKSPPNTRLAMIGFRVVCDGAAEQK
jgi:formylglycine-generating enzyme required for sulfatase activity